VGQNLGHLRWRLGALAAVSVLWLGLLPAAPSSASSVVFSDDWSLGTGSAWSSSRWAVAVLNDTDVDVVGGAGHVGFSGARRAGGGVAEMPSVGDAEVLVSFRFGSTQEEGQAFSWLRASGDWADLYNLIPSAGYGVQVHTNSDGVKLFRATGGGGRTILGAGSIAQVTSAKQWLRFRVEGNALMVKVWTDGTSEPSQWELVLNDSNGPATGVYQIGFSRSGGKGQKDVYFDDLTVTDLTP